MAKRLYQGTGLKENLEVIWLQSLDVHHTYLETLQNIPLKDNIILQLKTKTKQLVSQDYILLRRELTTEKSCNRWRMH